MTRGRSSALRLRSIHGRELFANTSLTTAPSAIHLTNSLTARCTAQKCKNRTKKVKKHFQPFITPLHVTPAFYGISLVF